MVLNTLVTAGSMTINTNVPGSFLSIIHKDVRGHQIDITYPVLEVDGKPVSGFQREGPTYPRTYPGGWEQVVFRFTAGSDPEVILHLIVHHKWNSPFLRFRYRVEAAAFCKLTKAGGADNLTYFGVDIPDRDAASLTAIDLAQYEPLLHSYQPGIEFYSLAESFPGQSFPGPVMVCEDGQVSLLLAYEHGADSPDTFLHYVIEEEGESTRLALRARKGNYLSGQEIGPGKFFESPWFQLGVVKGDISELLPRYREFLLKEVQFNVEASRVPRICYNTWNYQERNKLYNGKPYLESMNLERMLSEIEAAHQIGIDTFVIDTGWFDRPGDWGVHPGRFPGGLREVKRKLDAYGMQLGLWFDPRAAALSSQVYREHPEWEMSWQGQPHDHWVVWESEESTAMCLASDYADRFAEVMLRYREELGVTYFKWDGIGQFGCDSPCHHHGGEEHSPEERADSYAYQVGLHLTKIVERVTRKHPDVVVDFDVTENRRFVGLGFLSAGRYFLINNGSYPSDFDMPKSLGLPPFLNVFFFAGAARQRVCRRAAAYDTIVPSSLFLVHYLPDGPQLNLDNSLASLVLGGNGIWGDLPALSADEAAFWRENLADYKRVIQAAAEAYPVTRGFVGSSPEVHEKVKAEDAAGVVAFFTATHGTFAYVTQPVEVEKLGEVKGADAWEAREDGSLKITVTLVDNGARTVFILPKEQDKTGGE